MWSKHPFIVLSGPSGAGKSTLVKKMLALYGPQKMATLVSYTTRPKRGAEREGQGYHFVDKERFLSLKDQNFFAEWACVYNHYYGTAVEQINRHWREGRAIIKDFDLQGADSIKKLYPGVLRVFISPPSEKELIRRVRSRSQMSDKDMDLRMKQVQHEMRQIPLFDIHIKNTNVREAVQTLKKAIDEYLKHKK